jgi:hypothetical protein
MLKMEQAYKITLFFVCVCVSVYPHYYLLNALPNLYDTWYVYRGTPTHLIGLIKKSFPQSVSIPLPLVGVGSVKSSSLLGLYR